MNGAVPTATVFRAFNQTGAESMDGHRCYEPAPLALLWIELAMKRGHGRDFAFAQVRHTPSAPSATSHGAIS